jgi:hypothetical protein
MSELFRILQAKFRSQGLGIQLPSPSNIEKLLCNPRIGCKGTINLPAPVAKILLFPSSFVSAFGNIEADLVVYINPSTGADMTGMPPVGASPGRQYLLCGMIHELGHALGFMSSIGTGTFKREQASPNQNTLPNMKVDRLSTKSSGLVSICRGLYYKFYDFPMIFGKL